MTDLIANILCGAAARAGLPFPSRVDCIDGHLSVHTNPTTLDQWRAWCDLVAVDRDTETTKAIGFAYAKGSYRGYPVLLYGHGVPKLGYAARLAAGEDLPPFGSPLT